MKPGLALFDFDGTITTHDTMLELIRFKHGWAKFIFGFGVLSPLIVLMKAKILSAQFVKEKTLTLFFGKMDATAFDNLCFEFCTKRLPVILRKEAMDKLRWHLENSHRVMVVSASATNWIQPWAKKIGVEVIATMLQVENSLITGKLASTNCNGEEKVARIRQQVNLNDYEPIYAYGDTSGDKPMLSLAHHPFFRKF